MARSAAKGFKSWGDKTPSYILDVAILYELFPDSKYMYIVRDGRDVALSLMAKPWGPRNIFSCAMYWKKCNARSAILDELVDKKQLYFVRYEDLLDHPESLVADIYSFLDEQDKLSTIEYLIRRIRPRNYNHWKTEMSTQQIQLFEAVASTTLKRFGYQTTHEETPVNALSASAFKLHNGICRTLYLCKLNTTDAVRVKFFGKQPFGE
jgi:hypothetical protein